MVNLLTKNYTFEEYLNYHDDTDDKYELVNGELKVIPIASGLHALILCLIFNILEAEIDRLQQQWKAMPGTVGVRTAQNKSRIPDIVVLTSQQCEEIKQMTTAVLQSPTLLAVEIVSPGNPEDDYRYKRSEYAVREIPEYWIIDPEKNKVSVLLLISGFYDLTEYQADESIQSSLFPNLQLTVNQILQA